MVLFVYTVKYAKSYGVEIQVIGGSWPLPLWRMRVDGVFAVRGEFESEYLDSNPHDDEEDEDGLLCALQDT